MDDVRKIQRKIDIMDQQAEMGEEVLESLSMIF